MGLEVFRIGIEVGGCASIAKFTKSRSNGHMGKGNPAYCNTGAGVRGVEKETILTCC